MFWILLFVCLSLDVCTINAGTPLTQYIHGGRDTEIEDAPYILSLHARGRFQHGASILTSNWALTVATSIERIGYGVIFLRAGSPMWNAGGTLHSVKTIVIHPQYKHHSIDYNYALLEVEQPFVFTSTIAPVRLPIQGSEVKPYTKATISGWGFLNVVPEQMLVVEEGRGLPGENSVSKDQLGFPPLVTPDFEEEYSLSMNLKSAVVATISDSACQHMNYWTTVTSRLFCANFIAEKGNPCMGDRGGPLVVNGTLIGLAVTEICDVPRKSANLYSKVSDQRAWIDHVIGVQALEEASRSDVVARNQEDIRTKVGYKSDVVNNSDVDNRTDVDSRTGIDNKTEVDNRTGVENKAEVDNGTGVENKTEVDNRTGVENKTEVDNRTSVDNKTEVDNGTGVENKTEVDNRTGVENKTGVDNRTGVENKTEVDNRTGVDNKTEVDNGTGVENKTEVDSRTGVDNKTEVDNRTGVENKTDAESDTDAQSKTEVELNAEVKIKSDTLRSSDVENIADAEPKTDAESNTDARAGNDTDATRTTDATSKVVVIINDAASKPDAEKGIDAGGNTDAEKEASTPKPPFQTPDWHKNVKRKRRSIKKYLV